MRNLMLGIVALGAVATTGTVAQARTLPSGLYQIDYDGCGPHCQHERWEQRQEAQREAEHRRLEHHRDYERDAR